MCCQVRQDKWAAGVPSAYSRVCLRAPVRTQSTGGRLGDWSGHWYSRTCIHIHMHRHTPARKRARACAQADASKHTLNCARAHTHTIGVVRGHPAETQRQTRCQRAVAASGSSAVVRLAEDFFNPPPALQGRALARSTASTVRQARQRSWLASRSSAGAGASWLAGPEGLQGGEAEGGGGLPRERTHAHTRTLALTHARTHVGGRERLPTRSRADARTLTAAGP